MIVILVPLLLIGMLVFLFWLCSSKPSTVDRFQKLPKDVQEQIAEKKEQLYLQMLYDDEKFNTRLLN